MDRRSFLFLGLTLAFSGSILVPNARAQEATGSALTASEAQKLLLLHNDARAAVGVAGLAWSPELARHAQSWADHLAATGTFQHGVSSYGENLAGAGTVEEAVEEWLSERAGYRNEAYSSNGAATGHYTQMVWRDTKLIGCGKASAPDYYIWVCAYDPPGNMRGKKPY